MEPTNFQRIDVILKEKEETVTLHWQTAKIEDCFKSFISRNTSNRVGRRDEIV